MLGQNPSGKKAIRANFLNKRNSLSAREVHERSLKIQTKFVEMTEYINTKVIGNYFPIGTEVETWEIMECAFSSKKTVALPRIDYNNLTFYRTEQNDLAHYLIENPRFKIKEPSPTRPRLIEKIGLLIVPGIAFDTKGNRIGYGFGYYDRYLSKKTYEKSVGLAFDFQILEQIPSTSSFDKKIDILVSEDQVVFC